MKHTVFFTVCIVGALSHVYGQYDAGTGTRAAAMSNNHTALQSGVPDLYWNPGALAFSVTREFQVSLYGHSLNSNSTFFGTKEYDNIQRFRLANAGFSYALPASRGGMSIAGSYSNPIILDDAFNFSGSYISNDSLVHINDRMYHIMGNLDFWTLGFGIQVAPNFGIGMSAALVSGKSDAKDRFNKSFTLNDSYGSFVSENSYEGTYTGFDARIGLLYKFEQFQTGVRLVLPRIMHFTETSSGTDGSGSDEYRLYSSFSGAWGVSTQLPFCTVSAEVRSTLPYDFLFPIEDIPSDCQAGYFKTGGGAGVEIPLIVIPAVARFGYSYDELDLHPWVYDFIQEPHDTRTIDWSDNGIRVNRNLHRVSTGIGFTSATTSFDISYTFSTWGLTTNEILKQIYHMNRIFTSFTIRF